MAIVQISQIKHRHGVQSDLPQLATAELGWSIDTRKLYIGNGTLGEGAPEIGNTEILTEHSNLPNYTVYSQGVSDGSTANLVSGITTINQPAMYIQYAAVRNNDSRVGWIKIARNFANTAIYSIDEEYTESANIGMKWDVIPVGTSGPGAYVQVAANLVTSTGFGANIQYTVSTLSF
jgi:hypothetical protein